MARDAGELIDETIDYGTWVDWLGIPRHIFSTCTRTPDPAWRSCRCVKGSPPDYLARSSTADLRVPTLERLGCRAGILSFLVGIAGNQTAQAERLLRGLNLSSLRHVEPAMRRDGTWMRSSSMPASRSVQQGKH
jgi:hypothetical protein